MKGRYCLHPNCDKQIPRRRHTCGRHFYALPGETNGLRDRLNELKKDSAEISPQLATEIVEFYKSRMIGQNEVVNCRNECGGLIVWFTTRRGKFVPVNAETVEPTDVGFSYGRHIAHFTTCPNAGDFRK